MEEASQGSLLSVSSVHDAVACLVFLYKNYKNSTSAFKLFLCEVEFCVRRFLAVGLKQKDGNDSISDLFCPIFQKSSSSRVLFNLQSV